MEEVLHKVCHSTWRLSLEVLVVDDRELRQDSVPIAYWALRECCIK